MESDREYPCIYDKALHEYKDQRIDKNAWLSPWKLRTE